MLHIQLQYSDINLSRPQLNLEDTELNNTEQPLRARQRLLFLKIQRHFLLKVLEFRV